MPEDTAEALDCMKREISDGDTATKMHGEIQLLAKWCLGHDRVDDQDRNRRPSGFTKQLNDGFKQLRLDQQREASFTNLS